MIIVSFSGIDGAGKSTQISALESWLRSAGLRVSILRMWDDVVVCSGLREAMSRSAFGGDQGIGSPEKPLNRRDKNVSSPLLNVLRCFLYFSDAVSLAYAIQRMRRTHGPDVIIFDRYLYDELANLPQRSTIARGFIRMLMNLAPRPEVAYLLDADPEAARARKPEYPLEFLYQNRKAYLQLSRMIAEMIIVENGSGEEMQQIIRSALVSRLPNREVRTTQVIAEKKI